MFNIKVSVTALCIMGKCQTGVFVSVFCDARDSMDSPHNGEGHRDSAVSLYFLEITHFTLVEEPKVFKNIVWNIHSAPRNLCIFLVLKISYLKIYTVSLRQTIQLFVFFHIFTISRKSGFPGVFAC
jgi:hypothetical protein